MGYRLGIDLGTTYTAAAVCRSSGRGWVEPEMVSLGSRGATVASVLFLAADGALLVGEAAERRAVTDPDRVVREFKRRVGDPTPIVVAGRNWAPEELSARLVRWVVDRVAEREGGPADRIAVTHPASWGAHKKDLLGRALAAHGLSVTFLAEPQAAALHYASTERVPVGATIAVYDLGGGTFDAAVVRKGEPGFTLLGRPQGLERLGGIDFDEVVFSHVWAGMPEAFESLDDTDPAVLSAVSRIRRDCTEAKEALSSDTEVSISVLLPAARGSVRLHRSEFEQLIRPQVEQTVDALRQAVGSAGLGPEQLTAVLLVGGSSRIPLVAQLVSEQLGRPVAVDADPKNAIAQGAALAVSPQPTTSWPATAMPPVPPGSTGGLPPAAPPQRPGDGAGLPRSPERVTGRGAPMPARSASPPPPPPPPPRRPPGPVHESANALLSGRAARPEPAEQSWAPAPEPPDRYDRYDDQDWEPDWEEPPRRRPFGLYVGLAALAAVALIALVVLWWPTGGSGPGLDTGGTSDEPSVATTAEDPPSTRAPTRTTSAPAPAPPDEVTTAPERTTRRETTPPESSSSEEPPPPSDEPSSAVPPPVVDPPSPAPAAPGG